MSAEQIPSQDDDSEPQAPEQLDLNSKEAWIQARAQELQKENGWMRSYAIDVAWQEFKAKELKKKSS